MHVADDLFILMMTFNYWKTFGFLNFFRLVNSNFKTLSEYYGHRKRSIARFLTQLHPLNLVNKMFFPVTSGNLVNV